LLQLISDFGKTISTGFFQNDVNTESLSKCLRYLRNVIGVDATVAAFDAGASSYTLLKEMADGENQINFRGQIYLPVKWSDQSIWGFIKIENIFDDPTSAQIKKSIQAIKDLLGKNLKKMNSTNLLSENACLIVESSVENSHRVSTSLFQDKKFTAFINLSEWIHQDQIFTLKSLKEFSDSLLFVPEIMDLSRNQRNVLALYSLLPSDIKKSSLVVATKLSKEDLGIQLKEETNFLDAFSGKITDGNDHISSNILRI